MNNTNKGVFVFVFLQDDVFQQIEEYVLKEDPEKTKHGQFRTVLLLNEIVH